MPTRHPRTLCPRWTRLFRRKRLVTFGLPAVILLYLTYVFFAFDMPGWRSARSGDNARTLLLDTYSHKTHVTRDNREGERQRRHRGRAQGHLSRGHRPRLGDARGRPR
jgi:phosphonate transport system permease protein